MSHAYPTHNVTLSADGYPIYTSPQGILYLAGGDDANCTLPECPVELSTYGYRASLPFSATLIALYALCMVAQTWLGWKYKTWSFAAAMLLGCFVEILGYAGRIMMWDNPWERSGFIMQIVLITIGPVFFSAAIYVMIYQIAKYISPMSSRFRPSLFYWIFIPCDIISLILQAAGGAMSASSNGEDDVGVDIALAGLSFQVITLVFFLVCVADYMVLSRHVWKTNKLPGIFKIFCTFLTLATLLILVRCAYRVYELSEGYSRESEALRDQPLFIALEGVMIILASWCLVVAHPGPVFNSGEKSIAEKHRDKLTSEKPAGSSNV